MVHAWMEVNAEVEASHHPTIKRLIKESSVTNILKAKGWTTDNMMLS